MISGGYPKRGPYLHEKWGLDIQSIGSSIIEAEVGNNEIAKRADSPVLSHPDRLRTNECNICFSLEVIHGRLLTNAKTDRKRETQTETWPLFSRSAFLAASLRARHDALLISLLIIEVEAR